MKKSTKPPTLQDLFEQIREIQKADEIQENDLTMNKVAKEFGWGKTKSRRYLDALTNKGIVTVESIIGNGGKMTMVWRPK
jgi:response regulator of citrate/malate metabolism